MRMKRFCTQDLTSIGCCQFFFIPETCPLPTTATTEECSLATFNNLEDMYLDKNQQLKLNNNCNI